MSTYSHPTVGSAGGMPPAHRLVGGIYRIKVTVDIPAILASLGLSAFAANDVLNLAPLPAGTVVLAAGYKLTTAEGAASTVDIGLTGTLTQFFSNASINAAAGTRATTIAAGAIASAVQVTNANTYLAMNFDGTPSKAKMDIWALCVAE